MSIERIFKDMFWFIEKIEYIKSKDGNILNLEISESKMLLYLLKHNTLQNFKGGLKNILIIFDISKSNLNINYVK